MIVAARADGSGSSTLIDKDDGLTTPGILNVTVNISNLTFADIVICASSAAHLRAAFDRLSQAWIPAAPAPWVPDITSLQGVRAYARRSEHTILFYNIPNCSNGTNTSALESLLGIALWSLLGFKKKK